jgi:hypothetical protein
MPLKTLSIILWNVWVAFFKPKGIFKKLKEAKGGYNRHLEDLRGHHANLVIPLHQIQLGKDGAAIQVVAEILDVGKGVLVMEGSVVS